jgi:alpha-methylacyl-CoA racemase
MTGPLDGLKILDFSTLLPGPFATMMLADLGADVIRVESPTRVDSVRQQPPVKDGISAMHGYLNRNKRSLALDLKQPAGVEIVRRLVEEYDIVVEQFRPGVMARLGLDYARLREINPKLIYCSITGYGQDGPYRDRAGHDINYLAVAGVASYTGRDGPLPLGVQVADVAGGSLHATLAILAALAHRHRTGEGQYLDVSMTDAAFSLNAMTGAAWLAGGRLPGYGTERLNGGIFYDYYETADGRHLSVGSLEPQFLKTLCETLGHPEWIALGEGRGPGEQRELKDAIAGAIRGKTFHEWNAIFAEVDCCVEPVLTLEEAAQHPQLAARGMVVEVPDGAGASTPQFAHPVRYTATQPMYRHAGEPLGQQSATILAGLGYGQDRIAELAAQGVVKLANK